MKLAQFKRKEAEEPRLGILWNDGIVDVAALAQTIWVSGHQPVSWILSANSTLDVIRRGAGAISVINALINEAPSTDLSSATLSLDTIEFLPAVNAGKILAIGRN